ncbi:MAG: histidine kinase dimerization/phospho-acceptor domain-containing protein [Pseudorhodobacter sp.]|nr:histidine kinase dimerization/phospho-acceptor domain-containing protein [Pseudorhodobacter sp.]
MTAPPKKSRSLRRDLALGLGLGLTVLWLLAMLGTGLVLSREIDEVFDASLQETAERIMPLAVIELINSEADPGARRVSAVGPLDEYLNYVVRGGDGAVALYSHNADLSAFDTPLAEGFHTVADHRLFALSAVSGAYQIEVAEPLAHRREIVLRTELAMLAPLVIFLPFSLLGIAWFTNRSLRPVADLSRAVRARGVSELTPLQTNGLQSELLPIRNAVNRLMARLGRALEAERSFTANAAHELRTPVAATLAQTQRLIAEAPPGPLQARARTIEAELKRLTRLSEKLLQLSRAEGGGVLADTPQNLAPILEMVVADFRRAGQGGRLRMSLPEGGTMPARMDPDAFAILARNLIENALTHGDPAQSIDITMDADASFTVSNACPLIPPEALARLTTRFERAGARTAGSGLGLAIVAGIARGAGAGLSLHSPAPGRQDGFSVRVNLAP